MNQELKKKVVAILECYLDDLRVIQEREEGNYFDHMMQKINDVLAELKRSPNS